MKVNEKGTIDLIRKYTGGLPMNAIVIDLEFTKIKSKYKEERKICRNEIIEIGAAKVNEKNEIVDTFDAFVRPEYSEITTFIYQLTGITEKNTRSADSFSEVMDRFLEWIGDEEAVIYSWSMTDKFQVLKESLLKNYQNERLDALMESWVDLQDQFGKKLDIEQNVKLSDAISGCGIEFVGKEHSGADDAYNTALLYQLMQEEDKFYEILKPIVEAFADTQPLTYSLGSQFGNLFEELTLEPVAG